MANVEIHPDCLTQDFPSMPSNIQKGILRKIETLELAPEFGKPLQRDLAGVRSLTFGRYRILHYYDRARDTVTVLFVGARRKGEPEDVYAECVRARRLVRAGKYVEAMAKIGGVISEEKKRVESLNQRLKPHDQSGR
jgi:mRNA-degrading endonuclease RelE of RelBE toxin-antitoxin system